MTIGKLGQRGQVVIPRAICEQLRLKKGDSLEITSRKGLIVMKPKKSRDLGDTLTPEEEKVVARGFRQIKRGEYVTWDQLKDELDHQPLKGRR